MAAKIVLGFALTAALTLRSVSAHAALISPMPRNAVDRFLPAYKGGKFGNGSCAHPAGAPPATMPRDAWGPYNSSTHLSCWGCNCVNGTEPCEVAQTCVWFTEGTSIGCAVPGGDSPSPSPHCSNPMKATNNDPYYRTFYLNATPFSKEDITRWNPWRAPGRAPLYDPCGMAGGAPEWRNTALTYYDTPNAKQGELGTQVLPANPTGVVWKAGATVETKWNVRANHGGGYQYRICLSSRNLTEACFTERPLPFAGHVALEWANGSRMEIPGRYLSAGTHPPGSTWARNPLPYSRPGQRPQFAPPCAEDPDVWETDAGLCSGRYLVDVSLVDKLVVPASTPAGAYVLQFRYDSEETAQVWTSCADIEIES